MARYIVHGAGAIGSIFGAQLSRRGKEVVLVGRPASNQDLRGGFLPWRR